MGRNRLEELGTDGGILLKLSQKKYSLKVWVVFI
jgi:hypothetical protein